MVPARKLSQAHQRLDRESVSFVLGVRWKVELIDLYLYRYWRLLMRCFDVPLCHVDRLRPINHSQ